MARIGNNYCKKIYVTDDNPRNEDPEKIRKELLKFISKNKVINIGKRELAIKKAIQNADKNETILIVEKGHEDIQIYKNKIINISDKKIIKKINFKHKILSEKKQISYKINYLKSCAKISLNFNGLSIV